MKSLYAFFLGMREFRLSFTTHFEDLSTLEWYDRGRDLAHRLTFRFFDEV